MIMPAGQSGPAPGYRQPVDGTGRPVVFIHSGPVGRPVFLRSPPAMSDALLVLAFFYIGVPGGVWLYLQIRAAQKRAQTAYDWSRAEIVRRTKMLEEREKAAVEIKTAIGKLMQEVTALQAERGRLEQLVEKSGLSPETEASRQT